MSSSTVTAFLCDTCGDTFEDPGEAVYECSRCGCAQIGENRCESCNVFMAKTADESCPACEEPLYDPLDPLTLYSASDGSLHPTVEAADKWDADAPARAAADAARAAKAREQAEQDRIRREAERSDRRRRTDQVCALLTQQPVIDAIRQAVDYESVTAHIPTDDLIAEVLPEFPPMPDRPSPLDPAYDDWFDTRSQWREDAYAAIEARPGPLRDLLCRFQSWVHGEATSWPLDEFFVAFLAERA